MRGGEPFAAGQLTTRVDIRHIDAPPIRAAGQLPSVDQAVPSPISRARTDSRIRRFFARTTSCYEHAFLHDVRTGVLVQTIDLDNQLGEGGGICYVDVDVNERHAFVCTPRALYLYARGQDATKGIGSTVLLVLQQLPL